MTARSGICSVFRWFFPSVLVFTVGLGLVGDRRVAANAEKEIVEFASQIPGLHALLADQEAFESLSSMLDYCTLWDFCTHNEGDVTVHSFSFAGKEPHTTRLQTLTFTVTPDRTLPSGYRIEGPRHGFSYLAGDLPPIAPERECLKILRAAFGDDRVVARLTVFLDSWSIASISVEAVSQSSDHWLIIRSSSEGGREPHIWSWRVQEWSDSNYTFISGND
jgi:hypothetical protein